ncbi:hypothetical protein [Haloarchaeobius litoreus]|uniref:Uncharacterized protein n=1 Tax=Haloarchaeobius litoreus TaxID=755306 RepID=A0ABD6DHA9_9EURY|nr:hypothetical protein [Haloarchaeobius litoreus]
MRDDVDGELARLRDRFGDDEVVETRWLDPEHPPDPVYEPFRDRVSRWANASASKAFTAAQCWTNSTSTPPVSFGWRNATS